MTEIDGKSFAVIPFEFAQGVISYSRSPRQIEVNYFRSARKRYIFGIKEPRNQIVTIIRRIALHGDANPGNSEIGTHHR